MWLTYIKVSNMSSEPVRTAMNQPVVASSDGPAFSFGLASHAYLECDSTHPRGFERKAANHWPAKHCVRLRDCSCSRRLTW